MAKLQTLHERYLVFIENRCPNLRKLEQLEDSEQVTEAIELLFNGNLEKMKNTLQYIDKNQRLRGIQDIASLLYICQTKFIHDHCRNDNERMAKAKLFRKLQYERKF